MEPNDQQPQLRAMSFNIFNWDTSEAHLTRIVATVKQYMPDSIGFQEITLSWLNRLSERLPEYTCVGADRGDSTHERAAILFRTDKFICLESGTKWMSETPDIPSKFEESGYNRVVSYVQLEERTSGKIFVHANLHLDLNVIANDKQAKVAVRILKERFAELPCILTGDFNSRYGTPSELPLTSVKAAGFFDSRDLAPIKLGDGSWHGRNCIETKKDDVLDYVFVSDGVLVEQHQFVQDRYTDGFPTDSKYEAINGGAPSDHNPVLITYRLM